MDEFTQEERELLKSGIDILLDEKKYIPIDCIDALYKWQKYFEAYSLEKIKK